MKNLFLLPLLCGAALLTGCAEPGYVEGRVYRPAPVVYAEEPAYYGGTSVVTVEHDRYVDHDHYYDCGDRHDRYRTSHYRGGSGNQAYGRGPDAPRGPHFSHAGSSGHYRPGDAAVQHKSERKKKDKKKHEEQ